MTVRIKPRPIYPSFTEELTGKNKYEYIVKTDENNNRMAKCFLMIFELMIVSINVNKMIIISI